MRLLAGAIAWVLSGAVQAGGTEPAPARPGHFTEEVKAASQRGAEEFVRRWVVAPSAFGTWGRGPLSNAASCADCHSPGDAPTEFPGVVVRVSVPGKTADGGPVPHPVYGMQLQTLGILGRVAPEADIGIRWRTRTVRLPDGVRVTLREPLLGIRNLAMGPLGPGTRTSVRRPPPLAGVGWLATITDEAIVEQAAVSRKLGVPGRINRVWNVAERRHVLGRFGWKANQPGLEQQVASAFHEDIGVTSPLYPRENCTALQTACVAAASSAHPELGASALEDIVAYLMHSPAPESATPTADAEGGFRLFRDTGCAACHRPEWTVTLATGGVQPRTASVRPYTDLLLHDLGPALSDGRPEYDAGGREWRTAPLWGMASTRVDGRTPGLLHDGRARSVEEAILWHGGQAARSRRAYVSLPRTERARLVQFVESL